jgi:hypothetical protein
MMHTWCAVQRYDMTTTNKQTNKQANKHVHTLDHGGCVVLAAGKRGRGLCRSRRRRSATSLDAAGPVACAVFLGANRDRERAQESNCEQSLNLLFASHKRPDTHVTTHDKQHTHTVLLTLERLDQTALHSDGRVVLAAYMSGRTAQQPGQRKKSIAAMFPAPGHASLPTLLVGAMPEATSNCRKETLFQCKCERSFCCLFLFVFLFLYKMACLFPKK